MLLILPLWSCSAEVDLHDNEQKQRNFNQIAPLSKLNGIRAFDMPDFVGFSYSRALIGGPKTRFIKSNNIIPILFFRLRRDKMGLEVATQARIADTAVRSQ